MNIRFRFLLISTACTFLFASCLPVETTNPEKAYSYWAGTEPPKEIEIIHAQYYQSPHFSLEYEFFLKFRPTKKWIDGFIIQKGLKIDNQNSDWSMWANLPEWFVPEPDCLIYSRSDRVDRSRYGTRLIFLNRLKIEFLILT